MRLFVAWFCPLRRAAILSTLAKREKNLKLRIRAADVTISRRPPAFQAPYCKTGLYRIGFVKGEGLSLVQIKDKLGSGTFDSVYLVDFKLTDVQTVQYNGVFKARSE